MAVRSLIESLGVYIPEKRLSTEAVLNGCATRPDVDIETLSGIAARPIAAEGEYSIDLAIKAATKCFEVSRYGPEDIDLIISTNISRYAGPNCRFPGEPSTAAQLAAHLKADNALFFDITNACAGMLTGVQIVDSYIQAGLIKRGMVVSGEYITHLMDNAQRTVGKGIDPQLASLLLGDSGAAVIIEATDDPTLGFHFIDLYTAAEHCDLCVGTVNSEEHGGYAMRTDSIGILAKGIELSLEHIDGMLSNPTYDTLHFDWVVFHQVSSRATSKLAEELNRRFGKTLCTPENTVDNVRERGNTSSTSHFVALWDYIQHGKIRSHQTLLLACQASGMVSGVIAYSLDDLPERILRVSSNGVLD